MNKYRLIISQHARKQRELMRLESGSWLDEMPWGNPKTLNVDEGDE